MAITVIQRPQGHKLETTLHEATASNDSGDVLFTTVANHGLSDGDFIYIESDIESYNGFKYVDSTGYTTFKIKDSENSAYTDFKQAVDIEFMISVLDHGFQCVHLPIVYELASDLFPFNEPAESYTPNTILSFSEYAGNVRLNTQNYISDPVPLLKIELLGSGPLAGVYQITNVFTGSDFVIDLAYDADYDFDDYTIVKYYDNYAITVNIYAGLNTDHPWYDEKPIGLVASKKFIPDENNRVKFSIDEILRGFIKTRNNLALDTLPNNIDFLCEFYIGYYQSWDVVEDGELINQSDEETIDEFVGQAINAKNEFKDVYSGYLSDYIGVDTSLARWLTDFFEPTAIVGYFFDISFLNKSDNDLQVLIEKRLDGYTIESETLNISEPGKGVIRVTLEVESGYDQYCLTAYALGEGDETEFNLSGFTNFGGGTNNWTLGANPSYLAPVFPGWSSKYLRGSFAGSGRNTFHIVLDFSTAGSLTLQIGYLDSGGTEVGRNDIYVPGLFGVQEFTTTVEPTASYDYVFVRVTGDDPNNFEVTSFSYIEPGQITEEICIRVLEECSDTFNSDARLTQDGDLRLLE